MMCEASSRSGTKYLFGGQESMQETFSLVLGIVVFIQRAPTATVCTFARLDEYAHVCEKMSAAAGLPE